MPRIAAVLMLRSTIMTVSAPAISSFRGSLPHPTQPLCTLRVRRRRRLTQHSLPGGLLDPTWTGLAPADRASFCWRLPLFDHFVGAGEHCRRNAPWRGRSRGGKRVEHLYGGFDIGGSADWPLELRRPCRGMEQPLGRTQDVPPSASWLPAYQSVGQAKPTRPENWSSLRPSRCRPNRGMWLKWRAGHRVSEMRVMQIPHFPRKVKIPNLEHFCGPA
jgi:hypothetical protein